MIDLIQLLIPRYNTSNTDFQLRIVKLEDTTHITKPGIEQGLGFILVLERMDVASLSGKLLSIQMLLPYRLFIL